MVWTSQTRIIEGAIFALVSLCASGAGAQTLKESASQFNRGTMFASGELNNAINVGSRDASGNRVIVDGVIQSGSDNGVFSNTGQVGVQGTSTTSNICA